MPMAAGRLPLDMTSMYAPPPPGGAATAPPMPAGAPPAPQGPPPPPPYDAEVQADGSTLLVMPSTQPGVKPLVVAHFPAPKGLKDKGAA